MRTRALALLLTLHLALPSLVLAQAATETRTVTNTPTITDTPTNTGTPSNTPTPTSTPTSTRTPTKTKTRTPNPATDCCDCNGFCRAPVAGSCGGCSYVQGASCGAIGCRTYTPTRTPTKTITATSSPTVTDTFTSTSTPTLTATATITGTPSRTGTPSISPTVTQTPTQTATVTRTPTPTLTYVPAATPRSTFTIYDFPGGISSSAVVSFAVATARHQLIPAAEAGQRSALHYLDVVADDATTVTVVVGGDSFPFEFATDHLQHQVRNFAIPIVLPANTDAYVSQSGTANVVVQVGSITGH